MTYDRSIVVRFARQGDRDGVDLDPSTDYRVSVDGGPWSPFRSPWTQTRLDEIVEKLRNEDPQDRPTIEFLAGVGRELGEAIRSADALANTIYEHRGGVTVYWRLDYPELARIPWELASWWIEPRHHILLGDEISFVRAVPLLEAGSPSQWPTGRDDTIRMLYVWGERGGRTVPWEEHAAALVPLAERHGIALTHRAIDTIADLQALVGDLGEGERFDYVHLLAHGARAGNRDWGLQLGSEVVKGAQVAQALRGGAGVPSLVTLAACDSGNETDSQFGSVAYELHAHGIPMVVASQFKLRKRVSNLSVARVYEQLFGGAHPLAALAGVRRQLAPGDNESWSNEVVYTKYSLAEMGHGASVARQQAVLRDARRVRSDLSAATERTDEQKWDAIDRLQRGIGQLHELADQGFDPGETYGLLGSMARRIAYIASDPPDEVALEEARDFYLAGLEQAYSHYCGINAIHLSWLLGEQDEVADLLPVVRFIATNECDRPDPYAYWACATLGEVGVYAGDPKAARKGYREFTRRLTKEVGDVDAVRSNVTAARLQLAQFSRYVERGPRTADAHAAAEAATAVLDSVLARLRPPRVAVAAVEPAAARPRPQDALAADGLSAVAVAEPPAAVAAVASTPAAVARTGDIFSVEMLPAALGDSLWVEWGDAARPKRMLIDGGLSGTADAIRAKIDAVAAAEGGTCRLELLVVTHIDGDHIEGIIKLLGQPDLPIDVGDVWFNGRKHMPNPDGEDEEEFLGARQGEFLSVLIEERGLPWNQWRDGKTIYVPPESRGKLPTLDLPGGLKLTLVSPGYPELLKLSKTWEEELEKAGLDRASHEEILAALVADRKLAPTDEDFLGDRPTGPPDIETLAGDKKRSDGSRANGSSIAFLAEYGDRSCLLTGDAHWQVLAREIDRLLKERKVDRLPLTALKVPHHGSRNNLYDDLLVQLDCHRYLVSTDGSRFKHPDGAALARIVGGPQRGSRPGDDDPVDLIFNYRSEFNEVWEDDGLRTRWNFRTHYPEVGIEGLRHDVSGG